MDRTNHYIFIYLLDRVSMCLQYWTEDVVKEEESNKTTCEEENGLEKQKRIKRPQDVVYVHIYRGDFTNLKPSKDDMSALVITGTGEVYGTGLNTLIGWKGKSPMPMKEDGPDVLEDYVKVEALSGLGLRKIVVGLGFGAALTQDNQMYMWGGGPKMMLESDAVVSFQEYKGARDECSCGQSGQYGTLSKEGGFDLFRCSHHTAYYYAPYTASSPPPKRIPFKVFAKYGSVILKCLMCGETCTSKSLNYSVRYNEYNLNYCVPCGVYREVERLDALPPEQTKPPYKQLAGILDMDCSLSFFCTLSENNEVTLWRWKNSALYQVPVKTSENRIIKSVSCGKSHFVVITDSGDLYTFGGRQSEQIGWTYNSSEQSISLRKVDTPAPVEKVCCGDQLTLCLLSNHSIWFFYDLYGGTHHRSLIEDYSINSPSDFTDITLYRCFNKVFAHCDSPRIATDEIHLNIDPCKRADFDDVVMKSLKPRTESVGESATLIRMKNHCLLPSWQRDLYGKKQFADLTLKLANGEFPAHRVVLFGSSDYFKNLLTNQDTSAIATTLDMSSYNPRAYKVLLQYFYQVQPDDLELDDLFDLCSIATSYNEPDIVSDVINKLKSLIRIDNVLQILAKAKSFNSKALIEECANIICSPAFKDEFVGALSENRVPVVQN